jgi:putative transposase
VALARKKRDDCGARRAVSVKVKEAIEGLALQKPPLPVAALYRQVRRVVQDLGEPTPSYSVVYDIVHTLPADLVTLAHDGTKAYSNTFELVHRAKPTAPILSGRLIIRRSLFSWSVRMGKPPSRGFRSLSTITAEP